MKELDLLAPNLYGALFDFGNELISVCSDHSLDGLLPLRIHVVITFAFIATRASTASGILLLDRPTAIAVGTYLCLYRVG